MYSDCSKRGTSGDQRIRTGEGERRGLVLQVQESSKVLAENGRREGRMWRRIDDGEHFWGRAWDLFVARSCGNVNVGKADGIKRNKVAHRDREAKRVEGSVSNKVEDEQRARVGREAA